MDGKTIEVYSRGIAEYVDKEYFYEKAKNRTHKVTLILDVKAPIVSDMETL